MNLGINLNFTEEEKEILIKIAAAQDIQELSYSLRDNLCGKYEYKWYNVINELLDSNETKTALGYMITAFGDNLWNDLQDLFDTVYYMPIIPEDLNKYNNAHRKTERYKEWHRVYMKTRYGLTGKYIVKYYPELDNAEKFIGRLEQIDKEIENKVNGMNNKVEKLIK